MSRYLIVKAAQTCTACPSQWDAWTVSGRYLYLRYRSGIGTVYAYDSPDWRTWTDAPDGRIAEFGEPSLDGMISLQDFLAAAGLKLALNAEVS